MKTFRIARNDMTCNTRPRCALRGTPMYGQVWQIALRRVAGGVRRWERGGWGQAVGEWGVGLGGGRVAGGVRQR